MTATTYRITGQSLDYDGQPQPGVLTVGASVGALVIGGTLVAGSVSKPTDDAGNIDVTLYGTGQGHLFGRPGTAVDWHYRATFTTRAGLVFNVDFELTSDRTIVDLLEAAV